MRRSLKITAWVAGGLALLLLLAIGTVLIVGNTPAGRVQIERLVARLTAGTGSPIWSSSTLTNTIINPY